VSLFKLMYQSLTGKYQPQGDVVDGDFIIADAWGKIRWGNEYFPGPVNAALASFIVTRLPDLPMAVAAEVAEASLMTGQPMSRVMWLGSTQDRHYAYEIMEWGIDAMHRHGCKRPILVAHAYLVPRCLAIMRRNGVEPIVPPDLPRGFDIHSAQRWTRSPRHLVVKEPLVWTEHLLRHRISLHPAPSRS